MVTPTMSCGCCGRAHASVVLSAGIVFSSLIQFIFVSKFTFLYSASRETTLQTELLAVQALRGQLEEALGTTQEQIVRMQEEFEMPADSGGGRSLQEHEAGSAEVSRAHTTQRAVESVLGVTLKTLLTGNACLMGFFTVY